MEGLVLNLFLILQGLFFLYRVALVNLHMLLQKSNALHTYIKTPETAVQKEFRMRNVIQMGLHLGA